MTGLLQDYVSRQAGCRPDAVAIVGTEAQLTYGELEEASDKLATFLVGLGCERRDRVCLFVPKCPEAIVAMIATLKAGCAYVPIDVESPAARMEKIVRSVEPRVVIVDESGAGLLDEIASRDELPPSVTVVATSEPLQGAHFGTSLSALDWKELDASSLAHRGSSDDPAQLLFTSGSTGMPKGVVVPHATVTHFVEWARPYFRLEADDRISGHPPLHFDLSTFDIYGTFSAGAALHLLPREANLFPQYLAQFVRQRDLTQFFAVPSVLTLMASFDVIRGADFPALRRVLSCGEVLPARTLRYWMERLPHVTFTNLYGPTEATIASSFHTISEAPRTDSDPVPIGVACPGEELLLLDHELGPVASNEIGEIYIAGAGLNPGYWKDPDQTRMVFMRDPRGRGSSSRVYRTGDLGRIGADGLFYFVGRADSQIKHRGYRIELGEIENAVGALEVVRDCAVVAVQTDGFAGTAICCAYAPIVDNVGWADLRNALRETLPEYMLPTEWLALESLPTNANGKIDRPHIRDMFTRMGTARRKKRQKRSTTAIPT